jgi:hypothetical protein
VDELADSTSLLNDQGGLRRRLAGDGYLFFRGLLPAAEVRAVNAMDALADPAFRAAMSGAAFNGLSPSTPAGGTGSRRGRCTEESQSSGAGHDEGPLHV